MSKRWMIGAALSVAALGCGNDGGSGTGDDCLTLGCPAPFVCNEPDVDAGDARASCSSEELGIPACRGVPMSSPLSVVTTAEDDIPLHHVSPATCIPVTVSSSADGFREEITTAIAAFEAIACSTLCFTDAGASEESTEPLLAERRVHVRAAEDGELMGGVYLLYTTWFEDSTGRILGCEVALDPAFIDDFGVGEALAALMLCSGFETATASEDTVLTPFGTPGDRPPALTDADETALCALYGTPGYCAEDDDFLP